jgi:hypothetical protein
MVVLCLQIACSKDALAFFVLRFDVNMLGFLAHMSVAFNEDGRSLENVFTLEMDLISASSSNRVLPCFIC